MANNVQGQEPAAEAVTEPAKQRQQRLDKLAGEIAELNQHFAGWSFVIETFTFYNMDKSIQDLTQSVPKDQGIDKIQEIKQSPKGKR